MNTDKSLDIERILEILEEQVYQHTGRYFLESEKVLIKGTWEGKDYEEIARDSGYNMHYLRTGVARQLWLLLSEVIGNGIQVKKIYLKNILVKLTKRYYADLEVAKFDNNELVGKTRIYGELPKLKYFYGREKEIKKLKNEVNLLKQRCLAITGIGGIGKSFLTRKLLEEILLQTPELYEYVVWYKVKFGSSLDELLSELIKILNLEIKNEDFQTKVCLLSNYIHSHKCLIVLDGFERLLQADNFENKLNYQKLFIKLAEEQHRSCIIVTSQVPLKEMVYVTTTFNIESLRLEGLEESAAMQMLHDKGLGGEECKQLISFYRGDPSELEAVIRKIHNFFGGSVKKFFEYQTTLTGERLEAMLNQQFGQSRLLNNLQRQIMIYLAKTMSDNSDRVPFSNLINGLKKELDLELSICEVITSIEILEQRSLVEVYRKSFSKEVSYSLQPVIKKYILVDPFGLVRKMPVQTKIKEVPL